MTVRRSSRTSGLGVHGEPAYMLHRYEWSESSLILEMFTRNLGRVVVAAKGVRKPASAFRSVLLPFQPLLVSLGKQAQIRTLKGAEWAGGYAMPTGEPLLIGYYANELLMRLLPRDEAQPQVFDAYAQALAVLAGHVGERVVEPVLRVFELVLLRALGVLPGLDHEAFSMQPLHPGRRYVVEPESGLVPVVESGNMQHVQTGLLASQWLAIENAFHAENALSALPLVVEQISADLKAILRPVLNFHAGVTMLRTRQLMRAVQNPARHA